MSTQQKMALYKYMTVILLGNEESFFLSLNIFGCLALQMNATKNCFPQLMKHVALNYSNKAILNFHYLNILLETFL